MKTYAEKCEELRVMRMKEDSARREQMEATYELFSRQFMAFVDIDDPDVATFVQTEMEHVFQLLYSMGKTDGRERERQNERDAKLREEWKEAEQNG